MPRAIANRRISAQTSPAIIALGTGGEACSSCGDAIIEASVPKPRQPAPKTKPRIWPILASEPSHAAASPISGNPTARPCLRADRKRVSAETPIIGAAFPVARVLSAFRKRPNAMRAAAHTRIAKVTSAACFF